MYNPNKLSGKFSLEYLVHLCSCLEQHGSSSDYFRFSQNGVPQFEVSYDVEKTKLFEIKMLQPISEDRLDLLLETYSLKRMKHFNEKVTHQTLTAEVYVNVAQAIVFGSESLLNSEEDFELDSEFAQNVFGETMIGSQFEYPPFVNMALLLLWIGYEFVRYSFFAKDLSFSIGNIDIVEGLLFAVNCFFIWGSRPNHDDIPVFRKGTSTNFRIYKTSIKGCINLMIILIIVSLFTS